MYFITSKSLLVRFLVVLSVFAAAVSPSAVTRDAEQQQQKVMFTRPTTIPEPYFDHFMEAARLIDISYCISPRGGISLPFECHNECSAFPNMTLIHQFTGDNPMQALTITGYISIDHSKKAMFLSLRGTRSFRDALTDVDSQQISINHICLNCKVHKGFFETFDNTLLKVDAYLIKLIESYPDYRFYIMGHSLGGAIATLISYHVYDKLKFHNFECITLGQPVLGNRALAEYLAQVLDLKSLSLNDRRMYRITNKGDTVPTLPMSSATFEYTQLAGELFISNLEIETLAAQDVVVCQGKEDFNCIKNFYGPNLDSHLTYFKKLGYCGYGFGNVYY